MTIGSPYASHRVDSHYDAIVIGSGLGGLTTAALMAKAGKKLLVLERHYTAGGFTHSFKRRGYEWDVGLHYIGEVHKEGSLMRRLFDAITDGELKWAAMDPVYDKIIFGDDCYDYVAGAKNFRAEMLQHFPHAADAIDTYLRRIRTATRSLSGLLGGRYLPQRLQGWLGQGLGDDFRRSTASVMAEITRDARLAAVLTGQWGDYGLPPAQSSFGMHAVVAQHYLGGAAFPVGGASQIARHILPLIERAGGAVLTQAEVEQILVRGNRAVGVRLLNGDEITAHQVISGAGVHNTFGKLLPEQAGSRQRWDERLRKLPPSVAHLGLYIGLKATREQLQLEQANRWVYADYDHDRSFARAMASEPGRYSALNYLSFPSAKDPAFAQNYPGRSTIDVISLAPLRWFEKWQHQPWNERGAEYQELKALLAETLLADVYRQTPQVRGRIDHVELSTPFATQHFNNYAQGEVYGLAHTPARFEQGWVKPHTEIKGLFLTGQDILFCGVASAMMSGAMTATAALGSAAVKVLPELLAPQAGWLGGAARRLPLGRSRARDAASRTRLAEPPAAIRQLQARCVEVLALTHDVMALRFVVEGGEPLRYRAGQFMTLGLSIDGQRQHRAYTLSSSPSSSPSAGEVFEITVKRVTGGRVSNWLCDQLRPGSLIDMNGPHGQFVLPAQPLTKLLFLSAGSGVTPLLAMSRWLRERQPETDVVFFHSAKTAQDLIAGDELQAMADRLPRFALHHALTRSPKKKGELRGHLDATMLRRVAPDLAERRVYVCGPQGFMDRCQALLRELGVPAHRVHQESFGGPGSVTASGGIVHFVKSGKKRACTGQQSLLDVALAAGIAIDHACRTGDCGECKVRKLAGDAPAATQAGLAPGEADEGYLLSCVSYANDALVSLDA